MPPVCGPTATQKKLPSDRANLVRICCPERGPTESMVQAQRAIPNRTIGPVCRAEKDVQSTKDVQSKPKTRLESIPFANEPVIYLIIRKLSEQTRQQTDKYGICAIFDHCPPQKRARWKKHWLRTRPGRTPKLRVCGTGRDQKKITSKMKESPTMLLITKDRFFEPTMLLITNVVMAANPRC
jgi:hypothetical protein